MNKFIGPMMPVVQPKKQGIFGKIGGFLSKSVTDVVQSFAKVGSGGLNIASSLIESPLALIDKRLSFNPIKNLQNRTQDQLDNGINYIRGINKLTGLNIAGRETGGFGQIANNKMVNMGDAFNVATSVLGPQINAGMSAIARPFAAAAVERMGLSASGMTLGQIMKPGVMSAISNVLGRKATTLAPQVLMPRAPINVPKTPGTGLELFRPSLSPQVVSREALRDAERVVTESFEMYKVGLENVGFGLPRGNGGFNLPSNFRNIDLNPYDISGLSEFSEEGQKVAKDWIAAHMAYKAEGGSANNLIDALLYAGKRGDVSSLLKFNNYAKSGKNILQQGKKSEFYNHPLENLLKEVKYGGLESLTLDDLFLVHETQFAPPFDGAGNIILKPAADYKTIFPNDDGIGTKELIRDTIHMSINHVVQGHMQRPNIENAHYIVSKLRDVIDANPGALDSLYPVDTWFTPKPGGGLKIPSGSFETFMGGSSPKQKVQDSMNSLSQLGKLSGKALFRGGEHGSNTAGADQLVRIFGRDLNVGYGGHFNTPAWENQFTYNKGLYNVANSFTPQRLAGLNDNAISRLFSRRNAFSGVKTETEWLQGFKEGGYMPKFKKGGYLKFKEGGEVPSILHGGEYVLNAGAVKKYGLAHIEAMNQMRFNVPQPGFSVPQSSFSGNLAGGMTTSTQNVNIYVDNFIGEPEWFNSMMKDYNTTVLPRNQKAAGLENRVITTYSGLNRGN
jgi:hypothetical protein